MVTERSMSKMERAFGKNLNEFVATRLAAVFATINSILEMVSIIGNWCCIHCCCRYNHYGSHLSYTQRSSYTIRKLCE